MAFKKGEGGGKTGRKSPQPSRLLREARWVYEHPEPVEGESGSVKGLQLLRDLRGSDPERFLARLERLEKEHRAKIEASKRDEKADRADGVLEGGVLVMDESTERLLERIDQLLAEVGDGSEGSRRD